MELKDALRQTVSILVQDDPNLHPVHKARLKVLWNMAQTELERNAEYWQAQLERLERSIPIGGK